ncbi:MAG: glycosyltransferase [Candidatus Odinarchaeota archaeon]
MKKIKILYLLTGFTPGGAELTFKNIILNLNQDIYEISVCSITHTTDIFDLIKERVKNIYFLGVKNNFGFLKAFILLRKILNKENPDILHCFMYHSNLLGRFAAIGFNIQVISSIRTKLIDKKLINFLDNLTQRLVTVYMVNSKTLANFIQKYGIKKQKVILIENGVDFNKFNLNISADNLKKELNLPNIPIITMIANFKKQKDYPTMIKAIAHLQKDINVSFLAVGTGLKFEDETKQIKDLINSLNLKNFKLLGFRNDIPEILSITDIWVSSTLFEGQSNTLLEAMAMKKPIVTTNIPENIELVRNGKEAILIPIKSPIKIANAIIKLLQNKNLARQLSENAYDKVFNKFEISQMYEKIKKLYKFIV